MALSDAAMQTCRTQIAASTELAAFRTALLSLAGATRATRGRYYQAAFGDNQPDLSPAYRLRKVIRDAVTTAAGAASSFADREAAYQSLAAEFAPHYDPPVPADQEEAEFQRLLLEEQLS